MVYNKTMNDTEKLKYARNMLLRLHKNLIDFERKGYENVYGSLSAGQFLNVLLEDANFSWLRKFSMLIVEIDEMFAMRDGVPADLIAANLMKIRNLVEMREPDEYFRAKYQYALENDSDSNSSQEQLRALIG